MQKRYYGWDLSTKRSAIVLLEETGPFVEASWTRGPASSDINGVIEFLRIKLDRIKWPTSEVPFFFIDWSPTEIFSYPKTSKRYLNVKSFVAGWIYNELASRGAVVSFIHPGGIRKGLGINPRAGKEMVHQVLSLRYKIQVKKYNEHELDAVALALVGKSIIENSPKIKKSPLKLTLY